MTQFLSLNWTVSKGRDTYGYNIVTLRTDDFPAKKYRAMGGGYDMTGTVFGNWLAENYQDRIVALEGIGTRTFYGSRAREDGSVSLDGACGLESMQKIARAIGLQVERAAGGKRSRETVGWMITDTLA